MVEPRMNRALLLIGQRRFEQAASDLRAALAENPELASAHWALAICLSNLEQLDDAQREIEAAIALRPDMGTYHCLLAEILLVRGRLSAARTAIDEAIRQDPDSSDALAISGRIHYRRSDWLAALADAERGLECDPEDTACINLRAEALIKLGRRDEATTLLESALRENPEDADTHANQGWALLQAGRREPAMEHFREALRLEPGHSWARQGIIEAMKARSPVYRLVLAWIFWMSRFSLTAQWGIAFGSYLAQDWLIVAAGNADFPLSLVITLVRIGLMGFVLALWLASPLLNLTLLTDRFGRYALTDDERAGAWTVAAYLGIALIFLGWYLVGSNLFAGLTALWVGLSSLPAAMIFRCSPGVRRWSLVAGTAALTLMALAPLVGFQLAVAEILDGPTADRWFMSWGRQFPAAFISSQILAMALVTTPEQK